MTMRRSTSPPVPVEPRYGGCPVERQRVFIEALAETGSVSAAAETAGVSARSAYRLRLRAGDESFRQAWGMPGSPRSRR